VAIQAPECRETVTPSLTAATPGPQRLLPAAAGAGAGRTGRFVPQ
jgi:hypothetical protein